MRSRAIVETDETSAMAHREQEVPETGRPPDRQRRVWTEVDDKTIQNQPRAARIAAFLNSSRVAAIPQLPGNRTQRWRPSRQIIIDKPAPSTLGEEDELDPLKELPIDTRGVISEITPGCESAMGRSHPERSPTDSEKSGRTTWRGRTLLKNQDEYSTEEQPG